VRSFFKGNGTNVVKIAPETAIKLTLNDLLKHVIARDQDEITPPQRMVAGAVAGATAQVRQAAPLAQQPWPQRPDQPSP
jgi:solute carrier family 25 phosphate transporter 23/24/25/41